jgi:ParB family chromosome partitioning protein
MSMKEQPKRLGRGLAALLGDAAAPTSINAPGVQSLAVDLLEPSPFQPRKEMEPVALQELADSITQRGILQPLLVRPHPAAPGRYQLIAGERRWRAAQMARLHEIPVLVRDLSDSDAMAAGLVENLQREDLNPIEEAEGYLRLLNEFKLTQDTLGEAIGKSRAHITNALRVLRLPPKVLDQVRDGTLSMGHAKALLNHPEPEQGAKMILAKDLSVRKAEEIITHLGRSFKPEFFKRGRRNNPLGDEAEHLSKSLTETLGMKTTITFDGKKGSLVINYSTLDQLDTLLALLNR